MHRMNSIVSLHDPAAELVKVDRALQAAANGRGPMRARCPLLHAARKPCNCLAEPGTNSRPTPPSGSRSGGVSAASGRFVTRTRGSLARAGGAPHSGLPRCRSRVRPRRYGKEEGRLTVTLLIRRRVNEEQAGYERRADASLPLGGHEARKQRVA